MPTDQELIKIVPSKRQLKYQETEFYAFFHFGMNTYTNREWGDGTEDPGIFDPQEFDAGQWVSAVKAAGMKGVILTCKHHDGFCLWPTKYTQHSVASSPWKDGAGDVVREVSDACRRYGLKFGIYLSPWDRNQPCYGSGKEYDDYYIAQLTELLTGYGEIFSVWLDGACGEGPNGKKQVYDWERYYACVRKYQPDACICVCGPDIRWCGNEAGDVRKSEWSVVPARTALAESVQERSQQSDDEEFRQRKITSDMEDLGSRIALEGEHDLIWYPAEVNTSIRPGWFYHPEEDGQVKSLEELVHIYLGSVGGNATFLLNIPPMSNGLLHENDVERLRELGEWQQRSFSRNLLEESHRPVELVFALDEAEDVGYLVLKEEIRNSQRVEAFEVFVRVKHTENYWISNYGRCVNNANRKDKTTFYEHKQGKCHYSIFEMEKSIVSYPARLLKSGKLKVDRKKQKFENYQKKNIKNKPKKFSKIKRK